MNMPIFPSSLPTPLDSKAPERRVNDAPDKSDRAASGRAVHGKFGVRPHSIGGVHTLDPETRDDMAVNALVRQQMDGARALRAILVTASNDIQALIDARHFPLGSPTKGYDLDDLVTMLHDLSPTQTEREAEALADAFVLGEE